MSKILYAAVVAALSIAAGAAPAAVIGGAVGASSTSFEGPLGRLIDGYLPPNGSFYKTDTVSYSSSDTPVFTYNFNRIFSLTQLTTVVDHNDDYRFDFFNGLALVGTRQVAVADGTVTGGVETFTRDLTGLMADRVVVTTSGGDGLYSIGEIRVEGDFPTAAVPEPATWAMMILGVGLAGAVTRRKQRPAAA